MDNEIWIEFQVRPQDKAPMGHVAIRVEITSFDSNAMKQDRDPGPRDEGAMAFSVPAPLLEADTEDTRMGLCAWLAEAAVALTKRFELDDQEETAFVLLRDALGNPDRVNIQAYVKERGGQTSEPFPWPYSGKGLTETAQLAQYERARRTLLDQTNVGNKVEGRLVGRKPQKF